MPFSLKRDIPFSQIFEKWAPRLVLGLIMAWPLLIVTRGFDLTDSAYYLFNYRHAFTWPEVNDFTMVLSNWLNGFLWVLLPGSGQYLAFRVVCVAAYALVTWFSYVILREHFPPWLNLLALALANAYPTALIYISSYNSLSYLFLSAVIPLMYRGLERDQPRLLFLAAVLLGLNAFVRLPNILQWGLAAVPFWYYWFCLGQRRKAVRLTLRFCLAVMAAWLAFFGLCRLFLGAELIGRQLDDLMGLAYGGQDKHSAFLMLDTYDLYIRESWELLVKIAGLLGPLSLALAAGMLFLRRRRWAAPLLAAVGLAAGAALALIGGRYYITFPHMQSDPVWTFPLDGLCLFLSLTGPLAALAGLLWYHQRRPLLSALSASVIIIFMVMPFGSDYWLWHYLYYTHLTWPVVLGLVYRLWLDFALWLEEKRPQIKISELGTAYICANAFLWFLITAGLRTVDDNQLIQAHSDGPYGASRHAVPGVPVLAGLKTHINRAANLSEVKKALAPYQDLPLVILGQCPLCLFLSESEALLPNPWLDLNSLPTPKFEADLAERASAQGLPLVLMTRPQADGAALTWRNRQKELVLRQFMARHHYTLEAEHPFFRLFLPAGRGRGPLVAPPALAPAKPPSGPRGRIRTLEEFSRIKNSRAEQGPEPAVP